MAKITRCSVYAGLTVTMELTEVEVRALDGMFGYDVEIFLQVFKERMGAAYVEKHEAGVRSLHATIRGICSKPLSEVDNARRALHEAAKQIK